MTSAKEATIEAAVELEGFIRTHKPHPRVAEVLEAVRRHNQRHVPNLSETLERLKPHSQHGLLTARIEQIGARHRVFVTTLRSLEKSIATRPETRVVSEGMKRRSQVSPPAVIPAEPDNGGINVA